MTSEQLNKKPVSHKKIFITKIGNNNMKIDFVKENKKELIKQVEPNFIKNRFDLLYGDNYELIQVVDNDKTIYVPVHLENFTAKLGLYLVDLSQNAFNELVEFIFKYYKSINNIKINFSVNKYKGLSNATHYTIQLPNTEDEYLSLLGKKTRLHIKQYFKYIERDFNVEFKTFDKDIPTEIVKKYFEFKKNTVGHIYKMSEQKYLQEYSVTKAYVLYLNNKISAISFVCELPDYDGDSAYYKNFSYDKRFAKYSLGTVITYFTIKQLIENKYKNFYLGGGDYLYKKNLSNKVTETYCGVIKRKFSYKQLPSRIFSKYSDNEFNHINLLGLKLKKRIKTENCFLEINKDTKCLMVAPHPDDEILGAGALMIKYSNNFDCICIGSSGHSSNTEAAQKNSQIRIEEFNKVMDYIGIENRWIFETFGTGRLDKQILEHFQDYCSVLNLKQYDYIFLPHPKDGHHEHRLITNKLFRKIINKIGYNPNTKIVFYEVWENIKNPNVFFDTSKDGFLYSKNGFKKYQNWNGKLKLEEETSLLDLKYKVLKMYKSQFEKCSIFVVQTMKKCIQNGRNPIWRFKVVPIKEYM